MKTIMEANLYRAADELLDAEYLVQEKRRERDRLICRASAAGMTGRAIGVEVGLTRAAVGLIVKAGASQATTTGTRDAPRLAPNG